MKRRWLVVLLLSMPAATGSPVFSQPDPLALFEQFCKKQYSEKEKCPDPVCRLQIKKSEEGEETSDCVPVPCPRIPAESCPEDYCATMTDCSDQQICHYQMYGEKAVCGDVSYAGQDVDCCPGLVRRCGIEFYDGTCDMEGKNSVYNLPICIPCGDGICTNFENRCNCPEDCGTPPDIDDIILPVMKSSGSGSP